MKKPRLTLKEYFKKGKTPTESHFADLIDSMLIQDEDNILKLPNEPLSPLSIKAVGLDEALLNFYRVEQAENISTWQLKQKPGNKLGLSIHEGSNNRLFIESGTGNVGIGTTTPSARLSVVVAGAPELYGQIKSLTFQTSAGVLAETTGAELALATIGFISNNSSSLGIRALRTFDGSGWPSTAIGLGMDVDDVKRAGASLWLHANGGIGIGTSSPRGTLHIAKNGDMWSSWNWGTNLIIEGGTVARNPAIGIFDAENANPWAIGNGAGDLHFALMPPLGDTTTAPTVALKIDKAGNVGIGTTDPHSKLQVKDLATIDEGGGWANIGSNSYYDGEWKRVDANKAGVNLHMNAEADGYEFRFMRMEADGVARNIGVIGSKNSYLLESNVGIGTTDPKAKLTVTGDLIRRVAVATGNGPNDGIDVGQIAGRVLTFTKHYADTAIRIMYCDNFRVLGNDAAARWEIRIDGSSSPGGPIYQDKYDETGNHHVAVTILGYATGIGAGAHTIGVWVGPFPGRPLKDAFTGWDNSRWTIEAQEVWI